MLYSIRLTLMIALYYIEIDDHQPLFFHFYHLVAQYEQRLEHKSGLNGYR